MARPRSNHAGVTVKARKWPRPDGSTGKAWRMRFIDPDSGEEVWETCKATSAAAAQREAVQKHQALTVRKAALAGGAVPLAGKSVRDACEGYLERTGLEVRAGTIDGYRPRVERFITWCERQGIASTDDLEPQHVATFRAFLVGMKLQRGEQKGEPVSRAYVNNCIRPVRSCLFELRRARLLPHLNDQDIAEVLPAVRELRRRKPHLAAAEVGQLLRACLLHDAACCELTRAENAGHGEPGTTPRHPAIAPFVAFLLLTGCRVGEALTVRWSDVDLDAQDDAGRAVGTIRLRAEDVKTGAERYVGLEVSPGLRTILARLRVRTGGSGRVFGALGEDVIRAAQRRLLHRCEACRAGNACTEPAKDPPRPACYLAPRFGWQKLRRTCGTFLVCSPGIYGAGSAWHAAQQLGHSVLVAERSYTGRVRGIPRHLRTLDAVLGLAPLLRKIGGREPAGFRATGSAAASG